MDRRSAVHSHRSLRRDSAQEGGKTVAAKFLRRQRAQDYVWASASAGAARGSRGHRDSIGTGLSGAAVKEDPSDMAGHRRSVDSVPAPSGNLMMFWAMAYKISDIVMALTEAGIIERLVQAPASAEVLANEQGWDRTALARYLEMLALSGVLTVDDGLYGVPPGTRATLPLVTMEAQVRRWHATNGSLRKILETGRGAEPLTRIDDPTFLENYQRAMAASARALALHMYRYADLPRTGTIADIGGADGAVAEQLSTLLPEARFCVVDRAPVEPFFDARISAVAAGDRFRFLVGDASAPGSMTAEIKQARGVLVSNLLHLLPPADILRLVAFLRATLGTGARLVLYDQFVEPGQFSAANLMTVDWAYLGSGFGMTDEDAVALLKEHEFVDIRQRRSPQLPGALIWATLP
jgi:hypothetical protein